MGTKLFCTVFKIGSVRNWDMKDWSKHETVLIRTTDNCYTYRKCFLPQRAPRGTRYVKKSGWKTRNVVLYKCVYLFEESKDTKKGEMVL
jgi:hypothetical protein